MQVVPSKAGQLEGDKVSEAQISSGLATTTPLLDLDDDLINKTIKQKLNLDKALISVSE